MSVAPCLTRFVPMFDSLHPWEEEAHRTPSRTSVRHASIRPRTVNVSVETIDTLLRFIWSLLAFFCSVSCILFIRRAPKPHKIENPRPTPESHPKTRTTMDLSALREALPSVRNTTRYRQPLLFCAQCNQRYEPAWYDHDHRRCFFCMRFRSPKVTRYALLYETQWYFIQSGETDPHEYYTTYFTLLHRWADQKQLPFTQQEADYQEYLWLMIRE